MINCRRDAIMWNRRIPALVGTLSLQI